MLNATDPCRDFTVRRQQLRVHLRHLRASAFQLSFFKRPSSRLNQITPIPL
jgi:hypothetical protein